MTPFRGVVLGCVATLTGLLSAGAAQAGWQGVFQATCFHRSAPVVSGYYAVPAVSYYADPCACPCPQTVCTTNYVQRCYYQPVVTYQAQTYTEPVTTYRTSYYYEPVTAYRYTGCFDPCTCTYRQVATAYTTYRLRAQCCPVTTYVQRCAYVPVTTYRRCCYWEPQTCCSLVDPCTGAPVGTPAPAVPAVPAVPAQPGVSESLRPGGPGVTEQFNGGSTGSPGYNRFYPPMNPAPPEGSGSSRQRSQFNPPLPPAPQPPAKPIVPKYDRIAYDADPDPGQANLVGVVLEEGDNTPKAGAQLVFVNDGPGGRQETATADSSGRFRVHLTSGTWTVYVRDAQGQQRYHSKVHVRTGEVQQMTLVKNR